MNTIECHFEGYLVRKYDSTMSIWQSGRKFRVTHQLPWLLRQWDFGELSVAQNHADEIHQAPIPDTKFMDEERYPREFILYPDWTRLK